MLAERKVKLVITVDCGITSVDPVRRALEQGIDVIITIHVLAAMLWLGGMLFLGAVGAPVLRAVQPDELRQRLFSELGRRFRTLGWVAIGTLLLTGTANLHFRGLLQWRGVLGEAAFWGSTYGHVLAVKLAAVTLMIGVSALHDFVLGPRAVRAALEGGTDAPAWRRRAALVARANALIGLIVVAAAVRLAR